MDRDLEAVGQAADALGASFVATRPGRARPGPTLLLVLAGLLPILLAAGPGQAAETVVTSLFGSARAGGESFAINSRLGGDVAGDVEVVTDGRAGCALLHGDSLLVEMSPRTRLRIHSVGENGGPVVEIERGEARITTQRKGSTSQVEIQTPSAHVRPRSSTLRVVVDGATGDTLVMSLDNRALVASSHERHKRTALLNADQWVSVPQGQPPGAIRKLSASPAARLGGLVGLQTFRGNALEQRTRQESPLLLARIADADVPETAPAAVSSPFPTPKLFAFAPELVERDFICDPTSCGLLSVPLYDDGPAAPPVCTGIPGEHCQR